MKKGLILSWGRRVPRSSKIAAELHFEELYLINKGKGFFAKIFSYFLNFIKTCAILSKGDYERVVLVLPPTLSLYAVPFKHSRTELFFDLHNGVLRAEWGKWPFLSHLLSKGVTISHNPVIAKKIDTHFKISSIVLGDPLTITDSNVPTKTAFLSSSKLNVLVPLSYAKDEPLDFLLRLVNENREEINFILTGKAPVEIIASFGSVVTFTGFVDANEYETLLSTVDAVLCLTSDDDIQMCALVEAISYRRVVITKDNLLNKSILKSYPSIYLNFERGYKLNKSLDPILTYRSNFDFNKFENEYNMERVGILESIRNG
ncbi:hypothetical protein Q4520_08365 [Alteromonas sp. 1_MG-2023]|uniref:hypothetical protein n=1 Tax=Alteromonas sp. 1_MG-2023 TaxID=3062669 RepID=UPI0026E32579|nr:hypothetical protein [Alteromonas sp. 1_MG-2023]MDO6475432.1 hypothetical protein [Alteromonas sp. 1_MG-2023]